MRTYIIATAAITGFYPGLVLAQCVNPSGMSMPKFQLEALMTANKVPDTAPVFIAKPKPAPHADAAKVETVAVAQK